MDSLKGTTKMLRLKSNKNLGLPFPYRCPLSLVLPRPRSADLSAFLSLCLPCRNTMSCSLP